MPTVKEILELEHEKGKDSVILFVEGMFLKAYEYSAYILNKRWNFKPTVKFIKCVSRDVVSVGFPISSLNTYFPDAINDGSPLIVHMEYVYVNEESLNVWKNEVKNEKQLTCIERDNSKSLRQEIESFPLEDSTPMQCMQFVANLKRLIHAGEI